MQKREIPTNINPLMRLDHELAQGDLKVVPPSTSWLGGMSHEMRLAYSVLENGILDYLYDLSDEVRTEAEAWIWATTEGPTAWLYSFENICHVLHLDPAYLRRELIRQTPQLRQKRMKPMCT